MSREEEIKQAAKNRADQYEHPVDWNHCYHHYIQGAEWADQHPRKGLWDAEKVINYIYHHAHVRTFGDIVIDDMSVTEFIETMKKAMEE